MRGLFDRVAAASIAGEWALDDDKAYVLAALVAATHPRVVVEIGVWQGGSLIPMLLALKRARGGHALAIDAWNASASVVGQEGKHAEWWARQQIHDDAYRVFVERLARHELAELCTICRQRSDDAPVPDQIDVLHIDGNHAEQAVRDTLRFAPNVRAGGFACFDDADWIGGHVGKALEVAHDLGFDKLYPLGTGVMMQRRRGGRP